MTVSGEKGVGWDWYFTPFIYRRFGCFRGGNGEWRFVGCSLHGSIRWVVIVVMIVVMVEEGWMNGKVRWCYMDASSSSIVACHFWKNAYFINFVMTTELCYVLLVDVEAFCMATIDCHVPFMIVSTMHCCCDLWKLTKREDGVQICRV